MADRRLQVFHTVGRMLSFTKAAEALQMTQPAVTFQVRQLEEQFNVRLFDRSHNRIDLTEAGKRAYEYAERIFGLYGEMENSIRQVTGTVSGLLRIGASTVVGQYILPSLLAEFQNKYPDVYIQLRVASSQGILTLIENSFVDIGMIEMPVDNKKLVIHPFVDDELVFVVAKSHPLASHSVINATTAHEQSWIMREEDSSTRAQILDFFVKQGLNPNNLKVVMELECPEAVKRAVEAARGVTILPKIAVARELEAGTLVAISLDPCLSRSVSFVYKAQKFPLCIVDELITFSLKHNEAQSGIFDADAVNQAVI